jgi:mRNA interferase RelE/StbE
VKTIRFTPSAQLDLRRHNAVARRLMTKLQAYAATGAGDVTDLVGMPGKRLRAGDFRIIFDEDEAEIVVLKIGPRKNVYD